MRKVRGQHRRPPLRRTQGWGTHRGNGAMQRWVTRQRKIGDRRKWPRFSFRKTGSVPSVPVFTVIYFRNEASPPQSPQSIRATPEACPPPATSGMLRNSGGEGRTHHAGVPCEKRRSGSSQELRNCTQGDRAPDGGTPKAAARIPRHLSLASELDGRERTLAERHRFGPLFGSDLFHRDATTVRNHAHPGIFNPRSACNRT